MQNDRGYQRSVYPQRTMGHSGLAADRFPGSRRTLRNRYIPSDYCSANKQKLFGIGIRCLKPRRIKGSGSCTFENQLLVCCRMNNIMVTRYCAELEVSRAFIRNVYVSISETIQGGTLSMYWHVENLMICALSSFRSS